MSKLVPYAQGFSHWCPGCEQRHYIPTNDNSVVWFFDYNMEAPTFRPSIRIDTEVWREGNEVLTPAERCHYFIQRGKIEYCTDSTHALAGKAVDMVSHA